MRGTKTTILNLLVETFFAILPLIVLGTAGPGEAHTDRFWAGPEVSMTSCILYGLTLARWLQGAVFAANKATSNQDTHAVAASYSALLLFPLLGVIISVILIGHSFHSSGSWKIITVQILNLAAAIVAFFVLGGHGIKLAEGEGAEGQDDRVK